MPEAQARPGFRPGKAGSIEAKKREEMGLVERAKRRAAAGTLALTTDAAAGLQTARHLRRGEFGEAKNTYKGHVKSAGQGGQLVDVMLVIVITAVIGFVGLAVVQTTDDSQEFTGEYDNSSDSLSGGVTDAFDLVSVVYIVLMLVVIIGALVGLRGRRQ